MESDPTQLELSSEERPYSLDAETLDRIRQLITRVYSSRDDLYEAADQLNDIDLSAICGKLADDLAANSAHLEQIIAMHGWEPEYEKAVTAAIGEEIMKHLRQPANDRKIVDVAKDEQAKLAREYDETIAAIPDLEAKALLKRQKDDIEFGERVLGQIAKKTGESGSTAEK